MSPTNTVAMKLRFETEHWTRVVNDNVIEG